MWYKKRFFPQVVVFAKYVANLSFSASCNVLILKVSLALKIKIAVKAIGVKLTWNSPGKILGC